MKELRSIILSPKFIGTFLVSSFLILLSIYIGINDYRQSQSSHEESIKLSEEEMQARTSWASVSTRASRTPDPMQVFVSGVNNDIGRRSDVSQREPIKLFGSYYSEETLFALFRFFDLAFIIQVVLSLFAILFTYDAINGEKESGTIQLTFSNSLPRVQFMLGKFIGASLGLILPLLVPMLLGILLVLLMKIPFTAIDWLRLTGFIGISILYIIFFACLGIFTSILTKRSNISFLISLVAWVLIVFIVPRAASMIAGQMVKVPSAAELDSQREAYAKNRWNQHMEDIQKLFSTRRTAIESMTEEQQNKYNEEHEWTYMQQDDSLRQLVTKSIDDYGIRLNEDFRNNKIRQEKLTYLLSRFSPASAFQLAVMTLAQTDVSLKARYEDAMMIYRKAFNEYVKKKQEQTGDNGAIRIAFDSNTGIKISSPHGGAGIDASDAPRFQAPQQTAGEIFAPVVLDFGILCVGIFLTFGITFIKFLRYELN
jgi:ABC-type transport system involved in multi-copper enzyme maturation permease subunit